jgi:hypothetical protein
MINSLKKASNNHISEVRSIRELDGKFRRERFSGKMEILEMEVSINQI